MNLLIGENIRRLRRQRDLTQEEVAAHLGISFQAISKWERADGYPDITMLPSLANYFGVSVDELIGMDEIAKSEKYDEINRLWTENNAKELHHDNVILIRNSLKTFPNNALLLVQLSTSLEKLDGTEEEKARYLRESIAVQEQILHTRQILSAKIQKSIYHKLQSKVLHCSMEALGNNGLGMITTHYISDVRQIDGFVNRILVRAFPGLVGWLVTVGLMFWFDREKIVVVPRENILFQGSIRDNLTCGKKISPRKVAEVCKKIGIHEEILHMPEQYEAVLTENGGVLSGGQKQRLCLVRALLREGDVYLFDEPASALDTANRERLTKLLKILSKDRIIVVITHERELPESAQCVISCREQ